MHDIFGKINELIQKEETFALLTIVGHRGSVPRRLAKMLVRPDGTTFGTIGGGCAEGEAVATALKLLKEGFRGATVVSLNLVEEEYGGVGMTCGGKIDVAIEIVEPPPRLIVVGAGHMARAIAKMGNMLGFIITIADPMADPSKFREAEQVINDFVETGLPRAKITSNSYIVIVTRHKDDLPALRAALRTPACYIGLIGSKRRVVQAFQQLIKEGFSESDLGRVYAPIGIDIGAETPEEIAVSIFAEIIQLRRRGTVKPAMPMKLEAPLLAKLASHLQIAETEIDN